MKITNKTGRDLMLSEPYNEGHGWRIEDKASFEFAANEVPEIILSKCKPK